MPISAARGAILVVGGAGYIGSHMLLALQQAGYQPVVLDNLSTGHRDAVLGAELIVGDSADKRLLQEIFSRYSFQAVMHFASFIEVGESVRLPLRYYQNNVSATLNLLEVMLQHGVRQFIFSSTAAVYGEPQSALINETHPLAPINPYGRSKQMVEAIIQDVARSDGLRFAILRYFNAAGADASGRLAERHEPESHLIPIALQVARGQRPHLTVYGRDYPTFDGTCVRDYIHVTDLAAAHLRALEVLGVGGESIVCNLGTGHGYSVQQVIEAVGRVTGCVVPMVLGERRLGDPAVLVADAGLARRVLEWEPVVSGLERIVGDAWRVAATVA